MCKEVKLEINEEIETEEMVKESKLKKFGSKVVGGVKKHGKKALTVVGVGAVGLACYALGKNSKKEDYDDYDEETVDEIEIEVSDIEVE